MLQFIIQKMRRKKGMVLALLIGNLFLVSIVCCNLLYTRASLQRMINTSLTDYLEHYNRYPMTLTVTSSMIRGKENIVNYASYVSAEEAADSAAQQLGIPLRMQVRNDYLDNVDFRYFQERNDKEKDTFRLGSLRDMEDHIRIVAGSMPSNQLGEDGFVEVIISSRMMGIKSLVIGDEFESTRASDRNGEPIRLRVVGVFDVADTDDVFWVLPPGNYATQFMMNSDLFHQLFMNGADSPNGVKTIWYDLLEYSELNPDNTGRVIQLVSAQKAAFEKVQDVSLRDNFLTMLIQFQKDAQKVQTTIWVLQVPVFVLLAAFIFMVARQILTAEQSEISILKSRGASKRQILQAYLIQNMLLAAAGFLLGIPLSVFLCQMVGSANAFLEFVSRRALPITMQGKVLIAGALAAAVSVLVMTIPVFRYADVTIVVQKQKKTRTGKSPFWQKIFLDFLLLGVSLYGLYSFYHQKDALAQAVADGASLDPLLYLSSSLFIIGAGLFCLRLIPLLARIIYAIGKKLWSPSLYASFLSVIRTRHKQGFILLFLIFTIALGIFSAKSARTINSNEEQKYRYMDGADIVLMEKWKDNALLVQEDPSLELVYQEPDYQKYLTTEGVTSAAKVFVDEKAAVTNQKLTNVQLMGIHTKDFGLTAEFDTSLLDEHWYNVLNRMAEDATSLIVSSNFRDNLGYQIGDMISVKLSAGKSISGKICAFVDYWPSYNPYSFTQGTDGLYSQTAHYLVVAHLSRIQSVIGVTPYEVWLKTDGRTDGIYQLLEEKNIELRKFVDVRADIIGLKNDPVFQGTNGISTVSFMVILMLCAAGFLIYWIMSIHSRQLQFGIFRAMGMTMREILVSLVNEHIFISLLPIACGTLIGEIASRLFVPLIQISYASYDQPLPLRIAQAGTDTMKLLVIIGTVIVVCMIALGVFISRIRIAQTIKLGED